MKKLLLLFSFSLFFLSACGPGGFHAQHDPMVGKFVEINEGLSIFVDREFTPTIYYRPVINSDVLICSGNSLNRVRDLSGNFLVSLCQNQIENCALQGSCTVIVKKQEINLAYQAKKDSQIFLKKHNLGNCRYGIGARSVCVDPYFSVAADPAYYPSGTVIFVPRVRGLELPTGETHDGFFIVRDEGGTIKGLDRFDFFTGYEDARTKKNPFVKLGLGDPSYRFAYAVVKDHALIKEIRRFRNFPKLKQIDYKYQLD
jgi:3D (Asp-Asp-Asp) domain-containing protein